MSALQVLFRTTDTCRIVDSLSAGIDRSNERFECLLADHP
jgi:hypothetical protein